MLRFLPIVPLCAALGLAACAANGDPPPGPNVPADGPPKTAEAASGATAGALGAPADARDVAVLVLEQSPSLLRVTSSATRPRSSFGPAASWNGTGAATHEWTLIGAHGETIASGGIVARSVLEAPPSPSQKAAAAHAPQDTFAFTVKVPQPAPGESIEIAAIGGTLVARWP